MKDYANIQRNFNIIFYVDPNLVHKSKSGIVLMYRFSVDKHMPLSQIYSMKLIGVKFLLAFLFVTLFVSLAECSFSPTSLLSSAYKVYNWLKSVSNAWSYRLKYKTVGTWGNEKIVWFTADKTFGEPNMKYHFVFPYSHRAPSHQKEARNVIETEINKVLENLEDVASVRDCPTEEWVSKYVSEWQMNERSKFHCKEANNCSPCSDTRSSPSSILTAYTFPFNTFASAFIIASSKNIFYLKN
ncbi:hypothetical protein BJ944DRAFT_230043 [Cunninghamella echinulata]|nr:hypothetical protein BJ944DRAFT_230043 [Cunninghamella echinulata]